MTESSSSMPGLRSTLFGTEGMQAVFSDRHALQGMLDFEAALARAEAAVGVIPAGAVVAIEAACDAAHYDMIQLAAATAQAGNPAIPLVKALTARVQAVDAEAARYVHWGATSQDAMDTGLVLQLRAALLLIEADLSALLSCTALLAQRYRHTPMIGRTWLQQALPMTFGLKLAGWHSALRRHQARIAELKARTLSLQFGGAVGTLAALGDKGLQVAVAMANELQLSLPDLPWHGHRDRIVEVATAMGLLTGTLGKIARDLSLMMQTEVAEAFEPAGEGRGGSSTMPHKRNPVSAAVVLSAANRVPALVGGLLVSMVQEHERGLGGWHAEWEALPDVMRLTAGALAHMRQVLDGLEIDVNRMRGNLDATHGLVMAEAVTMSLAPHLGRLSAHHLIEQACRTALAEGRHLRDVLAEHPDVKSRLSPAQLAELFDPIHYIGVAQQLIDRALSGTDIDG